MLTSIFKRDVEVIRRGDGSYVNYFWVNGADTNFTIKANVQPTPAEVMLTLLEGYRTSSAFTLYTNTELRTAEEGKHNPDVVMLYNKRFLVTKISTWQNTILAHYEIIVVKDGSDVN